MDGKTGRQGGKQNGRSTVLYGNGLFVAVATRHAPGDDFGPIPRKWLQLMNGDRAGDLFAATAKGIRGGLVPEAPRCRSAMRRLTG
jgi:hypothetical protein